MLNNAQSKTAVWIDLMQRGSYLNTAIDHVASYEILAVVSGIRAYLMDPQTIPCDALRTDKGKHPVTTEKWQLLVNFVSGPGSLDNVSL
jgi:hypothetical protein